MTQIEAARLLGMCDRSFRRYLARYEEFDRICAKRGRRSARLCRLKVKLAICIDERRTPGRYVLTGSQQWLLSERISQSLAGRTALLRLLPFSLAEMRGRYPSRTLEETLFHGFYPRIHDAGLDPTRALADYVETYVQRDLRLMANLRDLSLFVKFLGLLAGRTGQLLNLSQLANDAGVSHTTARQWLSVLEAGFIVHLLPPWFANLGKRLVKAPKLYFVDVGLACYLLGITAAAQLGRHPLRGAGLYAVEVKAGATVASDYFSGLQRLSALMAGRVTAGAVVYGGDSAQPRSRFQVVPALSCDRLFSGWLNKRAPRAARATRTGTDPDFP